MLEKMCRAVVFMWDEDDETMLERAVEARLRKKGIQTAKDSCFLMHSGFLKI